MRLRTLQKHSNLCPIYEYKNRNWLVFWLEGQTVKRTDAIKLIAVSQKINFDKYTTLAWVWKNHMNKFSFHFRRVFFLGTFWIWIKNNIKQCYKDNLYCLIYITFNFSVFNKHEMNLKKFKMNRKNFIIITINCFTIAQFKNTKQKNSFEFFKMIVS